MRHIRKSLICSLAFITLLGLLGCSNSNNYAPVMNANLFTVTPSGQQLKNTAPFIPDHYMVGPHDTLNSIAKSFGMNVRELAHMNHLKPPYTLRTGQVLTFRETRPYESQYHATMRDNQSVVHAHPVVTNQPYQQSGITTAKSNKRVAKRSHRKVVKKHHHRKIAKKSKPHQKLASTARATKHSRWGWPAKGRVVSKYSSDHRGIEISGKKGEAVMAAAPGKVVYSQGGLKGYGNLIIVSHANNLMTAYAHNQSLLVKVGQQVKKGQKIATMGAMNKQNTGELYFEVRRQGKAVNPLNYLPKVG